MFKSWTKRKAEKELADMRVKLVDAIDENINSSQRSIEKVSKILIDFKKHKYHKHDGFLNLCIFSDIIEIDLTLLLERLRLASSNFKLPTDRFF